VRLASVVFAGFSAEALRDRILDAQSKWVFTTDEGKRGGRSLPLKQIVDNAVVGYVVGAMVVQVQSSLNLDLTGWHPYAVGLTASQVAVGSPLTFF
jgi:acyl-coenzyme A synthetase/AMP-(fatty) acid ligase